MIRIPLLLTQVSFAALGSGATNAVAVIESARFRWGPADDTLSDDGMGSWDREAVTVEEALPVVREAVQAGILNDLGSGSHVDLVIIQRGAVRRWRERLVQRGGGTRPGTGDPEGEKEGGEKLGGGGAAGTSGLGELAISFTRKVAELSWLGQGVDGRV